MDTEPLHKNKQHRNENYENMQAGFSPIHGLEQEPWY